MWNLITILILCSKMVKLENYIVQLDGKLFLCFELRLTVVFWSTLQLAKASRTRFWLMHITKWKIILRPKMYNSLWNRDYPKKEDNPENKPTGIQLIETKEELKYQCLILKRQNFWLRLSSCEARISFEPQWNFKFLYSKFFYFINSRLKLAKIVQIDHFYT